MSCRLALIALVLVSAPARAGLVAHYTFDEAPGSTVAHDSAASGINGTLSGSSAAFVAGGKSGNALSLTAADNDFANMGNNFGFTGGTDFSLSFWAKIANGSTTGYIPVAKHSAGQSVGYFTAINDVNDGDGSAASGHAHFFLSGTPGSPSTATINDGQFHMLTTVYHFNGGVPAEDLYVDGAFQNSRSVSAVAGTNAPFLVGGIQSNATLIGDFTGVVDDLQLYDSALSAAQIQSMFNNPGSVAPEPVALAGLAVPLALMLRHRRRAR